MGAAEAKLFGQAGATVVITDVDEAEGQSVAEGIGAACQFVQQDVALEADWQRVVAQVESEHGRIDVLVNNAGIFRVMGTVDTSLDVWDRLVAINQTGTFLGIRSVVPGMKRRGSGSIYQPLVHRGPDWCATRARLRRHEMGRSGIDQIRCRGICALRYPGEFRPSGID